MLTQALSAAISVPGLIITVPRLMDCAQVFKLNYSYDLPDPGRAMRNNGFAGKSVSAVLGGWTFSGITSFISGPPFTPSPVYDYCNSQNITGSSDGPRITVVGDPNLPKSQQTIYRTFNTAAFAVTPVGSFGNAAPGTLRGPGLQELGHRAEKGDSVGAW